jgi:hypothetical protein
LHPRRRLAPGHDAGELRGKLRGELHVDPETDVDPPPQGGRGPASEVALKVGEEGTLKAGRFTLFLHKNALRKDATVQLWVTSPTSMEVEFTVTPADANDFQVPARVTADLSDLPSVDVTTQTMYYWDGAWEIPNNVTADTTAHTIMATMHELSSCRVAPQPPSPSQPVLVNRSEW